MDDVGCRRYKFKFEFDGWMDLEGDYQTSKGEAEGVGSELG